MKLKVTLKTIAKEFGVSISTVSKALKNSPDIGKETTEKIQAFARMYNYKPNSFALNLRSQKSSIIGVVVPELIHHFFSEVISGIEEIANENGYKVMICLSNESNSKEKANLEMLLNSNVDGVIMSISNESLRQGKIAHINALKEEGVPLVLFDRVHKNIECDKVVGDDFGGGLLATKTLIDLGKKKIAILTTPDHMKIGNDRKAGYEKALALNGLEDNKNWIVEVDQNLNVDQQIASLFDQAIPDAVFAVNEVYAVKVLKEALKRGLNVPEDLSIIGYTNGVISKYSTPSLSSVVQNGYEMGKKSAKILLERINSQTLEGPYQYEIIDAGIAKRESTL